MGTHACAGCGAVGGGHGAASAEDHEVLLLTSFEEPRTREMSSLGRIAVLPPLALHAPYFLTKKCYTS
jgi:hypothetical protein